MISPNYESPFERKGYIRNKGDRIPMENRYWLVVVNKKPIALVRCWGSSQRLIYGHEVALSRFDCGEPLVTFRHTKFIWNTDNPSDRRIQVCINGLKKRQERKRPKTLPETSREEVRKRRNAGHTIRKLALDFGVSEATIKRICRNGTR